MNTEEYRAQRAETAKAIVQLLKTFPDDGRLPMATVEEHIALEAGFIQQRTINRTCDSCGTVRPNFTYYAITNAGRLLLALAETES